MAVSGYLQVPHELGICMNHGRSQRLLNLKQCRKLQLPKTDLSSLTLRQDLWSIRLAERAYKPICSIQYKYSMLRCYSLLGPSISSHISDVQNAVVALTRSYNTFQASSVVLQLVSAVGVIVFSIWGLGPFMREGRRIFLHKSDSNWKKSSTYWVTTSCLQPALLWTGATLICRLLDPVVLPTEASQIVKQRLLNFTRSLSTVLGFAYILSSIIQQAQKYFIETNNSSDLRNMGYQFAGQVMYTSVWVAAVSLFMELLGFSTQKWLTAGGLGTALLTLAGREIFTNFLSSVMIHATRPFVVKDRIQTRIEGYDVSGTVERVGWWSPTIIRGDDREAIHVPNHKLTVNVVRNLTQKTHRCIKTHLAISHLDADKMNNIIADMRKVLAKNPQVEHKRLHRRVFLENVDPENQGLVISISCFVKTIHHEEYLCVQECILLDLLRVISHHGARLATHSRSIQKIYKDPDLENVPFSDSLYGRGSGTTNRPLLLLEPPYKINGAERTKSQTRSTRTNGEQDREEAGAIAPDGQTDSKEESKPLSGSENKEAAYSTSVEIKGPTPDRNLTAKDRETTVTSTLDGKAGERGRKKPTSESNGKKHLKTVVESSQQIDGGETSVDSPNIEEAKQENERPVQQPISRYAMEDNIVIGVALEGSKRTLPIEDEMGRSPIAKTKELTAHGVATGLQITNRIGRIFSFQIFPAIRGSCKGE